MTAEPTPLDLDRFDQLLGSGRWDAWCSLVKSDLAALVERARAADTAERALRIKAAHYTRVRAERDEARQERNSYQLALSRTIERAERAEQQVARVELQASADWLEHVCGFDSDPEHPAEGRPTPTEADPDCGGCWQAILLDALAGPTDREVQS